MRQGAAVRFAGRIRIAHAMRSAVRGICGAGVRTCSTPLGHCPVGPSSGETTLSRLCRGVAGWFVAANTANAGGVTMTDALQSNASHRTNRPKRTPAKPRPANRTPILPPDASFALFVLDHPAYLSSVKGVKSVFRSASPRKSYLAGAAFTLDHSPDSLTSARESRGTLFPPALPPRRKRDPPEAAFRS